MARKIIFNMILILIQILPLILFKVDYGFLTSLNISIIPFSLIFILYMIISLLNSLAFSKLLLDDYLSNDYLFLLLINYIFSFATLLILNYFNLPLLSLISQAGSFITSLLIYFEIKKIDYRTSLLSIPYSIYQYLYLIFIVYINIKL